MKIGVLGGTFDPIHLGHLRLAEEIGEDLKLEKVYLIPSALPPHKEHGAITDFDHRMNMVNLASENSEVLVPLDLEGRRGGISFSIETLKELHNTLRPEPEIYFIIGLDAFLLLNTWKDYDEIFDYANFVIIERPGNEIIRLEPYLNSLEIEFRQKENTEDTFITRSGSLIICKKITLMDISSTMIREKILKNKSIRFLVPGKVRDYIFQKGLYGLNGNS